MEKHALGFPWSTSCSNLIKLWLQVCHAEILSTNNPVVKVLGLPPQTLIRGLLVVLLGTYRPYDRVVERGGEYHLRELTRTLRAGCHDHYNKASKKCRVIKKNLLLFIFLWEIILIKIISHNNETIQSISFVLVKMVSVQ